MTKKILALFLSAVMLFSLSGCYPLGAIVRRLFEREEDRTEQAISDYLNEEKGEVIGSIIIGDNGNGIFGGVEEDKSNGINGGIEEDENNNASIPDVVNKTLYYLYSDDPYAKPFAMGKFCTITFNNDKTFSLGVLTYCQDGEYGWYCPGGETSGEDSPYWTGTYRFDGDTIKLTFKNKVVEVYDWDPIDGSPIYLGEKNVPIRESAELEFLSEAKDGYYFNLDNFPLNSGFETCVSGKAFFAFDEQYVNILYPY